MFVGRSLVHLCLGRYPVLAVDLLLLCLASVVRMFLQALRAEWVIVFLLVLLGSNLLLRTRRVYLGMIPVGKHLCPLLWAVLLSVVVMVLVIVL